MSKDSSAVAELKLFGSTVPSCHTDPCRSSEKDITLEAASMEGVFSEPICVLDDGGKVVKEGFFAVATAADMMRFHMVAEDEESPTSANNGNREALPPPPLNQGGEETDEKIRKKPDKLLPCPRCKSLNTKFCYFNNCNVKQPRHFCKKCQRYWTVGGTLRNVPVGSGRRKSKHYSSSASYPDSHPHPHHPCLLLNMSDGLSASSDVVDSAKQSPMAQSSTIMKMGCSVQVRPQNFGSLSVSDSPESSFVPCHGKEIPPPPLCQSLGAGSIREQNVVGKENSNGSQETFASNTANQWQPQPPPPAMDVLARSSVVAQSLSQACETMKSSKQPTIGGGGLMGNSPFSFPVGPSPLPLPSPLPWPYGYGPFGWNNGILPLMPPPFDLSLAAWYGHPWMGGGLPWPSWGMPWNPSTVAMAAATASACNPILGKHPRDGSHTASGEDGCLLTPRTLRMQDPKEAAQSSIWSALGLDNSHKSGGIFKGFPPKADSLAADETEELAAQAFLANPAARNRSMDFHENG